MITLFGENYTRSELMRHLGDISQLARILPVRIQDGREDQVLSYEVKTGSGLNYSVIASRGLDISSASYCGCSLAWRSATSDSHPAFFDHEGEDGKGWLRSFAGGLVTTCGLSQVGATCIDKGQKLGLHGRINNTPAYQVSYSGAWDGDDYLLSITGKMREATVFGENLELTRTIQSRLGSNRIDIHDQVENLGYISAEHMMLYHINIGFPLVTAKSLFIAPSINVEPRDERAKSGLQTHHLMQLPDPAYAESVYFHTFSGDLSTVNTAIVNPNLKINGSNGLGIKCTFSPEQLPRFTQWKMMGSGTYVVGMEPSNCSVLGRAFERANGSLLFLEPGEIKNYDIILEVIFEDEISELMQESENVKRMPRE